MKLLSTLLALVATFCCLQVNALNAQASRQVDYVSQSVNASTQQRVNPNKKEEFIIQLKEPSVYRQLASHGVNSIKRGQRTSIQRHARAKIDSQQETFVRSLDKQFGREVVVTQRFSNLINAVVVSASANQLQQVMSQNDVKHISKVIHHKINKTDNVTNIELINADQVWQLASGDDFITGKGVTVAILDTGIDYSHPDLGGCFGAECKVYGGYDFINEDAEPFDDESHGTHVAGIVAANGTLRGVAPDASLLAVKVCDEHGSCPTTDIIEGLEYTLDPDGDPNTDDKVDIINMSLGSSQHDAAMAQVINDVVNAGITVVVAAGNDGPYENNIGSPGDVEKAITVAASNGSSNIADFSSIGAPSSGAPIMKPEVAAPGVSINSTMPNNEYAQLSGTSMASPMVAGAAALLKQRYPELTPDQVKASLMSTASPIAGNLLAEGVGLIDVLAAIELPIFINTPLIAFGENDFSQETFTKTLPFSVFNPSDEEQRILISVTTPHHDALTVSSDQAELVVPAKSNASANITLTANTAEFQVIADTPLYNIPLNLILSNDTEVSVPTTLFNRSFLQIEFGQFAQNYADILLFNESESHYRNIWSPEWLIDQSKLVLVPPGDYKLVVTANDSLDEQLREVAFLYYPSINIVNNANISVSTTDAIHKLKFDITKQDGEKITGTTGILAGHQNQVRLAMFNKATGKFIRNDYLTWYLEDGQEATFSFNNIPDGYTFHLFNSKDSDDETEVTQFATVFDSPIESDRTITFSSEDFYSVHFDYATPSLLSTPKISAFEYSRHNLYEDTDFGFAPIADFPAIDQGRSYHTTGFNNGFQFSYFNTEIDNNSFTEEDFKKLFASPHFSVNENGQLQIFSEFVETPLKTFEKQQSRSLTVGKLLPFWSGKIEKGDYQNIIYSYINNAANAFFRDSHYSYWTSQINISTNSVEDTINNSYRKVTWEGSNRDFRAYGGYGEVESNIHFDGYIIEDRQSSINTQLSFDLSRTDYSPPAIAELLISSANGATHQIICGEGRIEIDLTDEALSENVEVLIKHEDESEWQAQSLNSQDNKYSVELSNLTEGFYDLRLTATDESDNSLAYTAEPAFHVVSYEVDENDSDCDGVVNDEDAFPNDPQEWLDTDGDGIGNNADTDDDNDGVEDSEDLFPLDPTESLDADNDGIGNNADTDDDNDGVEDSADAFPFDATESVDTDNDGIGNNADTDDDNDGVEDSADAFPLDASRSTVTTTEPATPKKSSGGGGGSTHYFTLLGLLAIWRMRSTSSAKQ